MPLARRRQIPTHWIDGFLALEAKGWKGANDSAMASKANQIPFFRSVVAEMHARGRALLGGSPSTVAGSR